MSTLLKFRNTVSSHTLIKNQNQNYFSVVTQPSSTINIIEIYFWMSHLQINSPKKNALGAHILLIAILAKRFLGLLPRCHLIQRNLSTFWCQQIFNPSILNEFLMFLSSNMPFSTRGLEVGHKKTRLKKAKKKKQTPKQKKPHNQTKPLWQGKGCWIIILKMETVLEVAYQWTSTVQVVPEVEIKTPSSAQLKCNT